MHVNDMLDHQTKSHYKMLNNLGFLIPSFSTSPSFSLVPSMHPLLPEDFFTSIVFVFHPFIWQIACYGLILSFVSVQGGHG